MVCDCGASIPNSRWLALAPVPAYIASAAQETLLPWNWLTSRRLCRNPCGFDVVGESRRDRGYLFVKQERRQAIRRPYRAPPPAAKEGPRVNEEIRVSEVQLIDDKGGNLGVIPIERALEIAAEAGLDLVEIAPNSSPPVCKVLDFGRFKYQAQKKAAEARKKQKTVEIKEIKMRPNIDIHDYEVKMRSVRRFFEEGDKVKVTLRFRGREMAHQELGVKLLDRVREETSNFAKVESEPRLEGRQMTMVLAPR
jgi:translation initiation factor IF-3